MQISARETFRVTREYHGINLVQLPDGRISIVDKEGNEFSEITHIKINVTIADVTEQGSGKIVPVPSLDQGLNIDSDILNVANLGLCWIETLVNTAINLQD